MKYLNRFFGDKWQGDVSQDDLCSAKVMRDYCRQKLPKQTLALIDAEIHEAERSVSAKTAWRIEGTLREFPKFPPLNLWFDYPVHKIDESGVLKDIEAPDAFNSKNSPYRNNFKGKKTKEQKKKERVEAIEQAYEASAIDGEVTVADLAEYMGKSEKTVRRSINESDKFCIKDGFVKVTDKDEIE